MDLEQAMQEIFYHGFVFTLRPKKALEALKVIRKTLLDYKQLKADYIDIDKQLRTANTEIDRLQSVSSFIPCSERMPDEPGIHVLATDGIRIMESWYEIVEGRALWVDNYTMYVNVNFGEVTHWMPLPEIPQRKDDTHDND